MIAFRDTRMVIANHYANIVNKGVVMSCCGEEDLREKERVVYCKEDFSQSILVFAFYGIGLLITTMAFIIAAFGALGIK